MKFSSVKPYNTCIARAGTKTFSETEPRQLMNARHRQKTKNYGETTSALEPQNTLTKAGSKKN